jgi:hypothetical protein
MGSAKKVYMGDFKNIFKTCFEPLIGQPARQVTPGHGSFLTMEFGDPSKGHLWLYCCDWHVYENNKLVGDASLKSSLKTRIIRAAKYLEGKKLMSVSMSQDGRNLTLDFERGGQLVTDPYDRDSEQWFLYTPQGDCLVARADRLYSFGSSDSSADTWLAMFESKRLDPAAMKDLVFSPDSYLEMDFSAQEKRLTLFIEEYVLNFQDWEELHVRSFNHEKNTWAELDEAETLRDLCEYEIIESVAYLRGFGKESGEWLEWTIINANMRAEEHG